MPFRIEQGHGWYVWDGNEREYVLNFCHGTYSHYEFKPDKETKVAKPRLICDQCGQDITDAIDLRAVVNEGD